MTSDSEISGVYCIVTTDASCAGSNNSLFEISGVYCILTTDASCAGSDKFIVWLPRPQGYKTFFMLNSAEHEISNAHKYKYIKKISFFFRFR